MESKLNELLARVADLTQKLDQQNNRIERLEKALHVKTEQPTPAPAPKPQPKPAVAGPAQEPHQPHQAFEYRFGRYALQVIGIAVFLFGMGFLLKYSIEQGLISPFVRIVTGFGIATVLIAVSELLAKRLQWAFGLTGGGIILYYLTIYAAYAFYGLMTLQQAFTALCAVTIGATVLALRHDSRLIALFSLVGGMIAPLVLYIDNFDPFFLMYYLLALAAGFLVVSYAKQWFILSWLSFLALVLYKLLFISVSLVPALWFYGAVFVLYTLVPFMYALTTKDKEPWFETAMISFSGIYTVAAVINRFIYHNFSQKEAFKELLPFIATLFAEQSRMVIVQHVALFFGGIFLLFAVVAYYRTKTSHLFNAVSRLAIILFATAIFTKWTGLPLSIAYYCYALTLLVIGLTFAMAHVRWWSYLFWFMGIINFVLAGFDAKITITSWLDNQITTAAVIGIAVFALASYLTQQYHAVLARHEKSVYKRFDVAAVFTCFYWIMVVWEYPYSIAGLMWLGCVLFCIGIFCGDHLRQAAYGITGYSIGYFALYQTQLVRMQSPNVHLLFASLAAIFAIFMLMFQQYNKRFSDVERSMLAVIPHLGLAGTLLFWGRAVILSYFGFYAHQQSRPRTHAVLTVYYGAYALLLILIGLFKKERYIRYGGLAILGMTMYKLWFIIMGMPETLHRIIAFILVGVVFILASFAYQMLSVEEKK